MAPQLTKVVYQENRENVSFHVIVNAPEYARWKDDKSIPLVDVVDSYKVFSTHTGGQGILGQASKQELENTFGTARDDEVVRLILEKGKSEATDGLSHNAFASTNNGKGTLLDSRGSGKSTSGV